MPSILALRFDKKVTRGLMKDNWPRLAGFCLVDLRKTLRTAKLQYPVYGKIDSQRIIDVSNNDPQNASQGKVDFLISVSYWRVPCQFWGFLHAGIIMQEGEV